MEYKLVDLGKQGMENAAEMYRNGEFGAYAANPPQFEAGCTGLFLPKDIDLDKGLAIGSLWSLLPRLPSQREIDQCSSLAFKIAMKAVEHLPMPRLGARRGSRRNAASHATSYSVIMIALALVVAAGAAAQEPAPILVRRVNHNQSSTESRGYVPSYDGYSLWRTRSSHTYCKLSFDTLMEATDLTLEFKSKIGKRWVVTRFSGSNGDRDDYFKLVTLSDLKATIALARKGTVAFQRTKTGKWVRARS